MDEKTLKSKLSGINSLAVAFFKATEATMKAIDEIDKSKSSGNGRSLAIARTKLDECALWTNAALEAERLSTKLSKVKNVLED